MNLNQKVTYFFLALTGLLFIVLISISLFAFRTFSIASATDHIRTAGEIVRVHLTESMINGVIDRRENFLRRLMDVQGLRSARVVRSPEVEKQFGKGLNQEQASDAIEREVLAKGEPVFVVTEVNNEVLFRGTIPYKASATGSPNCMQCHQVQDGAVLGAVTMTMTIQALKEKALLTVGGIALAVALFTGLSLFLLRRFLNPISSTALAVENAVQRALAGDFTAQVEQKTEDEIGHIAAEMNRLLNFLNEGLNRIGSNIARLTKRTPIDGENLLNATIEMVESLTKAAHFKQAIEEDETKSEIYLRLGHTLKSEFNIQEFSLYELNPQKKQMPAVLVDGVPNVDCRWCDPQIVIRPEACRARRTGRLVDGVEAIDICYSFRPDPDKQGPAKFRHVCFPIMQSGSVGSVLQVLAPEENQRQLQAAIPFLNVYLREIAPVLETKRLMENLRESSLRDAMTGLNNRRFLEEYVETLVHSVHRRKSTASILMLDLDYFKMVNDTHGHDAGDAILKELAKVLQQSVRSADLVIRYGGEEFMIILLDTDTDGAEIVAENIRASVEKMKVQIHGTVLQKTISIGIAGFPQDSETFWQAVKFADVALYQAKEEGRNRVKRFNPDLWQKTQGEY
jgi:diguanylate cyclase (GGDEF)-like protein